MRSVPEQQQTNRPKYSTLATIRPRPPIHPEMSTHDTRFQRFNNAHRDNAYGYHESDSDNSLPEDDDGSAFQAEEIRRLDRIPPDYASLGHTVREELEAAGLRSASPLGPNVRRRPSYVTGSPCSDDQKFGQGASYQAKPTVTKPSQPQSISWSIILVIGVIVGLLLGLVYYLKFSPGEDSVDPQFEKQWHQQNYRHIYMIGNDFPSQTKTIWMDFFSGIKKVLLEKPTEPSIFLLLHHENDMTTKCLAQKVASVARDMMNVTSRGLLVVDGQTLGTNRLVKGGGFVTEYKPRVEEHRIMIVNDLQMVPADVARSLHAFCDTVTPLVNKAIYIFTLNVDQAGWNGASNPTRMAERELNAAWGELDNDIRQPLIVRITGGHVHKINRETDSKQC